MEDMKDMPVGLLVLICCVWSGVLYQGGRSRGQLAEQAMADNTGPFAVVAFVISVFCDDLDYADGFLVRQGSEDLKEIQEMNEARQQLARFWNKVYGYYEAHKLLRSAKCLCTCSNLTVVPNQSLRQVPSIMG
eukprot:jgi/Chrzof1/8087/UNPLg00132.t1